ncbi:MAG: SDR family oxidoreductase [Candidatus Scalindua sp.]|jgi:thioester reductase-like protein|nr:SDR family oxidoreductase [Candidatus Scalindua sp.]MBT5304835.1 SDR family oxidoreductase [Candidatus Scalindua sp.]MBT6228739.1 SDR family oxidoreductase [Candidatus Scalindua sp.]MBT6560896.1 SDR family oxidoreductase [Candidatus Scalindua sp.]MBT7211836.1 SDR family oxidoreductase [Candidatus Scalindua sp.]
MEKREKTILVTGSTGFLGSAITQRLLVSGCKLKLLIRKRDNDSSQISYVLESLLKELILGNQSDEDLQYQCRVVGEGSNKDKLLQELFISNVEIYEGDITSRGFGLETQEYTRLCNEVDEVFHCAAVTHFEMQGADEHMVVNVKGTENVLQFANSGKQKRFHYISTAYVAGKQNGIIGENKMVNEPLFNNEYERSKFVAEQLVIEYAKSNDIPYTIYRPGIIVGDSKTGATCKFDNLYLFVKVLFNMKNSFTKHNSEGLKNVTIRVPGDPDALINLVPIDYVADAIVAILRMRESNGKIFHITNPNPPRLRELRDLVLPFLEIKGMHVTIDRELEKQSLSAVEKLFLRQTRSYYSYLFSTLRFDDSNTQQFLKGTGIICPTLTKELVRTLIEFAVSHNWGEGKPTVLQKA